MAVRATSVQIGRLPYLYFLLLLEKPLSADRDWNTAVFILPFTKRLENMRWKGLEYCRIYTSSYSAFSPPAELFDWKTAVLLLPFTQGNDHGNPEEIGILPYYYLLLLMLSLIPHPLIGILPYYYFFLLRRGIGAQDTRLEDCRITTSFYSHVGSPPQRQIGILPYCYFLLLSKTGADS